VNIIRPLSYHSVIEGILSKTKDYQPVHDIIAMQARQAK